MRISNLECDLEERLHGEARHLGRGRNSCGVLKVTTSCTYEPGIADKRGSSVSVFLMSLRGRQGWFQRLSEWRECQALAA